MDAFTTHTGTAAPLRRSNVDTDQIIPAEYLKRITRTGFEDGLFVAWRKNEPEFVLNLPQYADASILVAGPDFGTGSSREHAVWALLDGGFRVVISPRFGDIFRNNSTKAGLLTVLLSQEDVEALWKAIEEDPSLEVTVDLQAKEVRYGASPCPSTSTTTPAGGCWRAWTTSASPSATSPTSRSSRRVVPPGSRRRGQSPCVSGAGRQRRGRSSR